MISTRPRVSLQNEHATAGGRESFSGEDGLNDHSNLIHYGGRFWVMWSDGPAVEARVGQRIKYATSDDGLVWSEPQDLTSHPPNSGPGSPFYGQRTEEGFRFIARGFWQRDGELLALASLDEADRFFGPSLQLHAWRWNERRRRWQHAGIVHDNTINNFAPRQLPTGEWMMTRRTHDYRTRGVQFLVGGVRAINHWESFPVHSAETALAAEEP